MCFKDGFAEINFVNEYKNIPKANTKIPSFRIPEVQNKTDGTSKTEIKIPFSFDGNILEKILNNPFNPIRDRKQKKTTCTL